MCSDPLFCLSACFAPRVTLIPNTSNLSSPLQFRRSEDLYLIATVELDCNTSLWIQFEWLINSCSLSNCLNAFPIDSTLIVTTRSELFIPGRTLPLGIYELKVMVTTTVNVRTNQSAFVQINPSGVTANLVPLGTSMITRGEEQDLLLNPGLYSLDLDEEQFNASDWNYEYFCRIYGVSNFPTMNGFLLPIDDSRLDPLNASCFNNRSGRLDFDRCTSFLICSEWIIVEIRRCFSIVFVDCRWFTSRESNVSMDGHHGEQTKSTHSK